MGAAWLGATALSIVIASAAVAGIRDRVVETPVAIGLPTTTTATLPPDTTVAPTLAATTTTVTVPTTTAAPIETTTTAPPSATETTVPATTTTTTTAAPVATTTTTAPPATTTTAAPVEYLTYDLVGGTVVLAVGNGEVNLAGATPRPGFSADYEHTGPKEVEIKFVSNDHKSKLEAKYENGELKVDTEEEDHGEGDGD